MASASDGRGPVPGLSTETNPYARLEGELGYRFRDRALLETALTHKSWLNEARAGDEATAAAGATRTDNERLEFLGDAVLNLSASDLLMARFPDRLEGQLSRARAQMVSETALARAAGRLGLGPWIFLGRGEDAAGGRRKPSILANTLEAVAGAIYLDGGFEPARTMALQFLSWLADEAEKVGHLDYKSRVQERTQALFREPPRYAVVAEMGPGHAKTFEVAIYVRGEEWGRATGSSKKEAEQGAAALALARLATDAGDDVRGPDERDGEPDGNRGAGGAS